MKLRPSVQAFAEAMEAKLRTHDEAKGTEGWKHDRFDALDSHLLEEWGELREAIDSQFSTDSWVSDELIDLANLAMMIWDNLLKDPS